MMAFLQACVRLSALSIVLKMGVDYKKLSSEKSALEFQNKSSHRQQLLHRAVAELAKSTEQGV